MKKILVPIDFSDVTDSVVENAKLIARSFDAELKIIHGVAPAQELGIQAAGDVGGIFIEPLGYKGIRDEVANKLKHEHKMMLEIKQKLSDEKIKVKTSVLEGNVSEIILSQINEYGPDLIIMGSHGHSCLIKALLGSITMFVLKHAKCPVTIIPSKARK